MSCIGRRSPTFIYSAVLQPRQLRIRLYHRLANGIRRIMKRSSRFDHHKPTYGKGELLWQLLQVQFRRLNVNMGALNLR